MDEAVEWGLTKLACTTTICADGMRDYCERHGLAANGYVETAAQIQREPDNPHDSNAVAVYIEGNRIGYLPGDIAGDVCFGPSGTETITVRIFTTVIGTKLRCEAWYWMGTNPAKWDYSSTNRPPMTLQERAREDQRQTEELIRSSLEQGGSQRDSIEQGMFNGVHYLETVEPIKQLKREGRLEEALTLCMIAINGAENEARHTHQPPASWYTEQAAIVLRKLKRPDEEEAILRRWLAHCPPRYDELNPDDVIVTRLRKIIAKRQKAANKASN